MKIINSVIIILILGIESLSAQIFNYDEKIELSNNLFKVKSGNRFGVIDNKNNVVVSIEYDDIHFREGYALLTKEDVLYGVLDSIGTVNNFNGQYKIHPFYKYVYNGYIPVSVNNGFIKKILKDKWGYVNIEGKPLKIKKKGGSSIGKKYPTLFDGVSPFVEGLTCVFSKNKGWKHIDSNGVEHFLLDKDYEALYRSSVYKGECIIVTKDGIKLCQEDLSHNAIVKYSLTTSAILNKQTPTEISFVEGSLFLDSLNRVTKFKNYNDSIILINNHKKTIVPKVQEPKQEEPFSLKDDISVKFTSKKLKADSNAKAYTKVVINNNSNMAYSNIHIKIYIKETGQVIKDKIINLQGRARQTLFCTIPARFSTNYQNRSIVVSVTYKNQPEVIIHQNVIIKRYMPVRSR